MAPSTTSLAQTAPRATVAVWAAFAALALGQLLVDIDDVVLNIALPSVAEDLQIAPSTLPWVVNAYVITFGGLLLLGGRLADRYGHRAVLLSGVAVFVASSTLGALAQGTPLLVGARAGQGLAAALLAPAAMSLLVLTFPDPEQRTRALGIWGAVTGAGAVVGLVVGGTVTEFLGWRWIFSGNALAAVVVGTSVLLLLPGGTGNRRIRIEPVGTVLATSALVLLVSALHGTLKHGWASPRTVLLSSLALICMTGAVLMWRAGREPLVPAVLLRDRSVLVSDACGLLVGAALLGTFYFVSLHLQQVAGYTPVRTACAYLPLVAGLVVAAGVGAALVPRRGVRPVLVSGMGVCGCGLALLALLGVSDQAEPYVTGLLPGLLVTGLGLGLAFVSLTVTAVPGGEAAGDGGVASGLYNTALQVGGALGIAILATAATAHTDALLTSGAAADAALAGGRDLALLLGSGLLLAGMPLAWLLPRSAGRGSDTERHGVRTA